MADSEYYNTTTKITAINEECKAKNDTDVIIVGAGVVGAALVHTLAKILWGDADLEMIRKISLYKETIKQKTQIEELLAIKPVFTYN